MEIEPAIFTDIFDKLLENFENILYCVCPGVGGYDAACLLVKKVIYFKSEFR